MIKLGKKGVNWVQILSNYMRVLNELAREELSWKNPFEVYYDRIPNNIQNAGRYISKQVPENYGVIYGLENKFKINCMTKLMMSPINSIYQRGDHWGSV